ncbi:DUF4492 domain-containing protein [Porphyromonas sp.]|jgi:hypothetical protein|uniref:DUF4492 domain-containing protein n=1 Tax=uncultured Porphyromonas sp. TaxID=159274 RepID=UPI0026357255|nr:DUF4492 domain-containing protein [uncultured Porphyromonas sp.]
MNGKTEVKKAPFWRRAFYLYYDGFRSMSRTSKVLWTLALIKLFIMFAILRPFFFPRVVEQQGDKEQQANFVMEQITHEK